MYSNTLFFNIFQNVPNATELPVSHNLVFYNETQSLFAQYLLWPKDMVFLHNIRSKMQNRRFISKFTPAFILNSHLVHFF